MKILSHLLASLSCLATTILSINHITQFPQNITIFKEDFIGYSVSKFLNGSNLAVQAFPKPVIETLVNDEPIYSFSHNEIKDFSNCLQVATDNSLEFAFVCDKTKVYYLAYKSLSQIEPRIKTKEFDIKSIADKLKDLNRGTVSVEACTNIELRRKKLFISCYSKNVDNTDLVDMHFIVL